MLVFFGGKPMITVEGVYKNGRIELLENVSELKDSKVLITFLNSSDISLDSVGINESEAAELRDSLSSFEDWNDPALDIYNDYDNAKSALAGRA
jgi:hypothetical protein